MHLEYLVHKAATHQIFNLEVKKRRKFATSYHNCFSEQVSRQSRQARLKGSFDAGIRVNSRWTLFRVHPELTEDKEKPTAVCAKKAHKGGFDAVNRVNSGWTLFRQFRAHDIESNRGVARIDRLLSFARTSSFRLRFAPATTSAT